MKLLLAIDSSAQSEIVVSEVIRRPWPAGTEVCVLTVVDLLALFGGAIVGLLEPFTENENKAAESLVRSVRTRLASRGLSAASKVLEDHPSTAIVEFRETMASRSGPCRFSRPGWHYKLYARLGCQSGSATCPLLGRDTSGKHAL
jgi:hypothetical protein